MADNQKKQNTLEEAKEEKNKIEKNSADGTIFSADYEGEAGNTKAAKKRENANKKKYKPLLTVIAAILAVGILVGVYFLVTGLPGASDEPTGPTYPTDANGEQYAVDLKGNKIDSVKNANGDIISAGIVTLTDDIPANLKKIDIANESGQFEISVYTPTEKTTNASGEEEEQTEKTEYTLKGFEDADIESGQLASIGTAVSTMTSTQIVDIKGENLHEYGFDKPRATVKAEFLDGKKYEVKVANQAPGGTGTYVMVNDDPAVYLVADDKVSSFFFNPLSIISTSITDSASTEETNTVKSLTLSGTNFKEKMVFVPNDDQTNAAYYKMTQPMERPVNVEKGSGIIGSVRNLIGESVVAFNPTKEQMKKYGLDKPYAAITAEYKDTTYHLSAAKPNDDDIVTLYSKEKDTIYTIALERVPWVTTSYDEMVYEYVLRPNLDAVKAIDVTADGKKYTFAVDKTTKKDAEGNETSQTTAKYGKLTMDAGYFDTYFTNLVSAQRGGTFQGDATSKTSKLSVTFQYNTDKEPDTITYYAGDSRKYMYTQNGIEDGFVYDTYISKIIEDTKQIIQNKKVDPI